MNEIERLQENLLLIRRTVGWTAEEFGECIGVTRQTINNLEAKRNKLTKTQYIAIRAILDAEMAQSPDDTEMLRYLLELPETLEFIKKRGFLIKLDSNGSNPDMLRKCMPYLDYIAMDIKCPMERYEELVGLKNKEK